MMTIIMKFLFHRKEELMKYTSDLIKAAIRNKHIPIVNRGMIAKFKCPICGFIKMVKFAPPENSRRRVHACVCGYRKGFKENETL